MQAPGVAQAAHTEATTGRAAVTCLHAAPIPEPSIGLEAHRNTTNVLILPPGTPSWITAELITHTLQVWQPRYAQQLGIEDAIDMIRSVARLSDALTSTRQS